MKALRCGISTRYLLKSDFFYSSKCVGCRYADDPTLERERKMKILADDPMAAYMMKKVQAARAHLKPEKPEYKGPPPRPNRFNIRPGYRWDGIDRGNQWEARWFKKQGEMISRKEEYNSWSMADL